MTQNRELKLFVSSITTAAGLNGMVESFQTTDPLSFYASAAVTILSGTYLLVKSADIHRERSIDYTTRMLRETAELERDPIQPQNRPIEPRYF
jgi:hypothetical protein